MTFEFKPVRRSDTRIIEEVYEVSGAEPVEIATRQRGGKLVPSRVWVKFRQEDGKEPVVFVTVHGPAVKKDGTTGVQEHWTSYEVSSGGGKAMPNWLQEFLTSRGW